MADSVETKSRQQIVNEFFKRGHVLTEEALDIIEESGVIPDVKLPAIVRAADLRKPYKILSTITSKKTDLATEDFVRFYNSKYEKMRDIIAARLPKNYISLNKIDGTRSEVYVIGIVRDIKEKDGKKIIDLEDKTATIPVIFEPADADDLELDDVVAVKAISGGKVLFGKKVMYPDIPLRQPVHGTGRACFVSNLHIDEAPQREVERFFEWFSGQDIQYLFVAGGVGDTAAFEKLVDRYCYTKTVFAASDEYPGVPDSYTSTRIVPLSNPALVEVGGLKVLVVKHGDIAMLKKRHLGKANAVTDEDQLTIEEVPDVMHTGGASAPVLTNYKSVTLVNSGSMLGEFHPIVVDFATRDAEKINL
ncbi:MAG TPA: hypothetical protein VJI12_00830 [archaeon]|nr:hypothetical protein [archaeon]